MTMIKNVADKATWKAASLTPAARRKLFLRTLADTANVTRSAKEAGFERSTVYRLRTSSASFRTAWDEAMNQALDDLEAMLLERAAHGVERPVFYGGKPCGTIRHYSDTLAMFILRARRPETYNKTSAGPGEEVEEDDPVKAREAVHSRLNRIADRLNAEQYAGTADDRPADDSGR